MYFGNEKLKFDVNDVKVIDFILSLIENNLL